MQKHGVRYLDDFLSFGRASECAEAKTTILDTCYGARVKPGGNGSGNRERVKPGAGNHAHNEFELDMFQVYCSTMSPGFAGMHR